MILHAKFDISTSNVPEIWMGSKNFKSRSRDPFWPNFAFLSLVPLVMDLHAKFGVSSSNRSRDMQGSQNFKSSSCDPLMTPFDLILHFFRFYPWWSICLPNLTFLALTVPEICRGSQNFKSRSRDPSCDPLWPNFAFLSSVPLLMNLHAKFGVSSSNCSRDMEGIQKFQN